jgi:hypothetical protein
MEKFLDTYDHPKLSQEDINHLSRSITQKEIEAAIKSLSKKKNPGHNGLSVEFYQTFKEELMPKLLKLFHEMQRELHSMKKHCTHPKTRQGHIQKGELQANLLNEH